MTNEPHHAAIAPEPSPPHVDEAATIGVLSIVYGAFYFCRTNLSAAVTGMTQSIAAGGLALSSTDVGSILGSLKLSYGLGQLVNGQLAEHVSPRRLLAMGMLGSAAMNVLFGFSAGFYALLAIWAANGYFQSLGWPASVRVASNWAPAGRRGRAIGVMAMGYQVTLGLTYVVAGFAADAFGWRGAVFVPAGLLVGAAIFMLVFLRDAPEVAGPAAPGEQNPDVEVPRRAAIVQTLLATLSNPALWILGVSLGLLNACRYGFVDWGVTHLKEVQETTISTAALKYLVLAVGALAGAFLTGWATDRFFGGRRAPVICGLLVLLSVLTLLYGWAAEHSVVATVGLMVLIGFCIFGPQVLLVGTAPADLARRGTPAAAAGFVDFLGYLGAALGDVVTGRIKAHGGWQLVIYVWAGWALAGAVTAALLWNAKPRGDMPTA
ncbi:MAG: MFS transporter [Planctomycetia bacterium]|nr:MFS transporter [Planctomycetia bacterium]